MILAIIWAIYFVNINDIDEIRMNYSWQVFATDIDVMTCGIYGISRARVQ